MSSFYPPVGFYFKVLISGSNQVEQDIAFKEASGISMTLKTSELEEGGANFMNRKLPGRTTFSDLELKRGLLPLNSKLSEWCFNSFGSKSTGQIKTETIVLQLLNSKSEVLMSWTFFGAYPIKWDVSGFNAQQSAIVVESISLSYTYYEAEAWPQEEEEDLDLSSLFG
jgi:phage tail-like protein